MKNKILHTLLSAMLPAWLAGCAAGPGSQLRLVSNSESSVMSQDQPLTLVNPLTMRIDNVYWADQVYKAGYDKLPPAFREQQKQFFVAKPSAKFLVIEFSVTNGGQSAGQWPNTRPPVFMLQNAGGAEYASVGQDINMEDLTAKTIHPGLQVNPGMTVKGTKVFDVPKGDYIMNVSLGRHAGGWSFVKGPTMAKVALRPKETMSQ